MKKGYENYNKRQKYRRYYDEISEKGIEGNNLVLNDTGIVDMSDPKKPKILLKKNKQRKNQEYYYLRHQLIIHLVAVVEKGYIKIYSLPDIPKLKDLYYTEKLKVKYVLDQLTLTHSEDPRLIEYFTDLKLKIKYKKLFVPPLMGHTESENKYYHNSKAKIIGHELLIQTGEYTYVYLHAYGTSEFTTGKDKITEFYSVLGNNDVAYNSAVGKKNIYLLTYDEYIERSLIDKLKKPINISTQKMIDYPYKISPYGYYHNYFYGPKSEYKVNKIKFKNTKIEENYGWYGEE